MISIPSQISIWQSSFNLDTLLHKSTLCLSDLWSMHSYVFDCSWMACAGSSSDLDFSQSPSRLAMGCVMRRLGSIFDYYLTHFRVLSMRVSTLALLNKQSAHARLSKGKREGPVMLSA